MPNTAADRDPAAPIHVMVAVVFNHRDEVLIALRQGDAHLLRAGDTHPREVWEFPGGKVEPGESLLRALHRELREETGLRLLASHPLCRIRHRYPDKQVLLDVRVVSRHVGKAVGREGQRIDWRPRQALRAEDFPAANARIIELLRLPRVIAITPDLTDRREFLRLLRKLLDSGRELIHIRQTRLPPDRYRDWFLAALELAAGRSATLLFNNAPRYYDPGWPNSGLHAPARVLAELQQRPVPADCLFGAACHSLLELRRAEQLEADFALLSPVCATGKYRAADLLGWNGFRRLADQVALPVYALGGTRPAQAALAQIHGGAGVAGIGNFV